MGADNLDEKPILAFDWQSLTLEQQQSIQQQTGEIRERLRRSAQDIWEIGQRLTVVRSQLKHGQFDTWLKVEFGWSRRTAYNFISVYEAFKDRANFAQLDIATSALYLMSSPSTPPQVRDETLKRALKGEKITHKTVRQALDDQSTQQSPNELKSGPNIVAIIPKASVLPAEGLADSEPMSQLTTETIRPGWYRLGTQHQLFCGDTASPTFFDRFSYASLVLAITSNDWDHDWIVEKADSVIILRESALADMSIEQLISTFSKVGETVVFPWLPHGSLVTIAHQLGRKIIAGDPDPVRCTQAVAALELSLIKV